MEKEERSTFGVETEPVALEIILRLQNTEPGGLVDPEIKDN